MTEERHRGRRSGSALRVADELLVLLFVGKSGRTIRDLAAVLDCSTSTVHAALNRLLDRGLVAIEDCPTCGQATGPRLTEAGRAAAGRQLPTATP